MAQNYEIRNIDGTYVFLKRIRPYFWIINDMFVSFTVVKNVLLNEDVLNLLKSKDCEFGPYFGSKDEWVIVLEPLDDGTYNRFQYQLEDFRDDESLRRDALNGLMQYDRWRDLKEV